ncbi:hypothetical protein [Larkinella knui]|uniref:Uncharacterized protein n=1 Tax=Larkinella knui TaxID=2025310 RepID=A0A3P1CZM9_9BACT|nr:hypothetical protein [Larkinella knui]RRB18354.1 hypothetical protein EHT87_08820 [Larkinella knui]
MDPIPPKVIFRPVWHMPYCLLTTAVVVGTVVLHWFAHWLTSELLGEHFSPNLNPAHFVRHVYVQAWHEIPITLAGPIFTVVQAIYFYNQLKRSRDMLLYPCLLAPVVMRILAGVMNVVNPNDEGRISSLLGWGLYTLPVITGLFLFYLVVRISIVCQINFKLNVQNIVLVIFISYFIFK